MKVYVINKYVKTSDYNGNIDEHTTIYSSLTEAIDSVRTMFWDEMDKLEKDYHIDSDNLYVSRNDGYCRGVIEYRTIGMNEYEYTLNISCAGYDVK